MTERTAKAPFPGHRRRPLRPRRCVQGWEGACPGRRGCGVPGRAGGRVRRLVEVREDIVEVVGGFTRAATAARAAGWLGAGGEADAAPRRAGASDGSGKSTRSCGAKDYPMERGAGAGGGRRARRRGAAASACGHGPGSARESMLGAGAQARLSRSTRHVYRRRAGASGSRAGCGEESNGVVLVKQSETRLCSWQERWRRQSGMRLDAMPPRRDDGGRPQGTSSGAPPRVPCQGTRRSSVHPAPPARPTDSCAH